MKKSITFFITRAPYAVTHKVDLSKLSFVAMSMADQILTTDQRSEYSYVGLKCKYPNRELYRRVMDAPDRYERKYVEQCKVALDQIEHGDPWCIAEEIQTAAYKWDALRFDETPEEYFERHAANLEKERTTGCFDMELAKPMNTLRYYRIKWDISQQQLAELSGVNKDQISRIERGQAAIGNITLTNACRLADVLGIHAEQLVLKEEI